MKSYLYYLNPNNRGKMSMAALFLMGAITCVNAQQKTTRDSLKTKSIDEVVVIGYGSQKRKDVNSSISSIKAADIASLKQVNADQMLQGKLAGVVVTSGNGQLGAASSIRVRGTTSLTGVNEPLYIIDGVPISGDAGGRATTGRPVAGNDFSSTGGAGNTTVSPISFLNPNDIESVDVLKDASAVAIYGARGANGVIIITTKSGKKGTGKISYDGSTIISEVAKFLPVMNLQEYATLQNNLAKSYNIQLRPEFAHPELLGKGTDWQNEVFQIGFGQTHQLGFSGGKDGVNYYLSGNYMDQSGVILDTGMKRYTFRGNFDAKVKNWLKIGTNISSGVTNEKFTVNQSFSGLITNLLLQAPDMPVVNLDGTFASPPGGQNVNYFNPVAEALERENRLIRKNFMGSVYGEVNLVKGLKYRAEISANTEFSEHTDFSPSYDRGSQANLTADLVERRQNWYSTNIQNLLTYDVGFNKHKFTVLLGQEANDVHWDGITAEGHGFKSNDVYNISMSDSDSRIVNGYKGSQAIYSLFSRLIYDFDNKYSFTASIRRDQSSKFDPVIKGKQVGYFPSVSVSWKVSNENFMENIKDVISHLKIRAGYGETGNQQIPNGRYAANLSQFFLPSNISNPDLTWESMKQTDIGIDLTLFNKLNINADVYRKISDDFLLQYPLPDYLTGGQSWYGGLDSPYYNMGQMRNQGVELTLNYSTKNNGSFNWDSTLVMSHNENKLLNILNGITLTEQANMNGYQPYIVSNTIVGNSVGTYWGFKTDGLFTSLDQLNKAPIQFDQTVGTEAGQTYLGDVKYVDINGDGKISDADRTIIGDPNPKLNIGFTNNFKYKNFDLSVFLYSVLGNDVMNLTRRNGTQNSTLYYNQFKEATDYWTEDNPNAKYPRLINSTSNRNLEISDRYIEKGDYLRIQNVTFGYTFSPDTLSTLKMSKIRIYGTIQNLYTFTDYKGYDPEIGLYNQNPLLNGIDNGRYPTPRTYSIGVNLEF